MRMDSSSPVKHNVFTRSLFVAQIEIEMEQILHKNINDILIITHE